MASMLKFTEEGKARVVRDLPEESGDV